MAKLPPTGLGDRKDRNVSQTPPDPPDPGPDGPPPYGTPPAPEYGTPPPLAYPQPGQPQPPGYPPAPPTYGPPYGPQGSYPPQQGYPPPPPFPGQAAPGYAHPGAPYGLDPYGRPYSDKSKIVAGILQLFLGWLGAGRWYTGHYGMAVAQLLTCGGLGIWTLIDGIILLVSDSTDAQGRLLRG